jgi:hypothetical protein
VRSPTAILTILLMTGGLLAGCLGGDGGAAGDDEAGTSPWSPGPPVTAPDCDFQAGLEQTHDHSDPAMHMASCQMEFVGYSDVVEASQPGVLGGGHAEVAVAAGYAFVANWGPHRGFSIIDVSDPTDPVHVSDFMTSRFGETYVAGAGSYWDVSVTADGNLTILSAQALANPPTPGHEDQVGGGVFLVNTEDKGAPFEESYTPVIEGDALIPVGVHNARPFEVDGVLYVAATTANGRTHLMEVLGEVGSRTLNEVSVVPGMHDTAVQVHPITGETYIYGAQGGVHITDISDPSDPVPVAMVPNSAELSAYHQVIPNDVLVDGVHYTVAATESTEGRPTPFTILDTTDPYDPFVVGRWILPMEVEVSPQPYRWSGHNLDVTEGRLYIAHYHAGVWVVDISSAANAEEPVAIGFYLPHEARPMAPRTLLGVDVPSVWGVVMGDDGFLYASDVNTGVYILEFTGPPSPWAGAPTWPSNVR